MADPQGHDRFHVRQRIRPIVNQYDVSLLGEDGKAAGERVCFVQQRRFKLKEELTAYTDDAKSSVLFRIKARQRWDPRATYDVTAADGSPVGSLKKAFGRSLTRSTWELRDAEEGPLAVIREQSGLVAVLRRLLQFLRLVPYIGGYIFVLIPYHFDFLVGEREVGEFRRVIHWRDLYRLDLSADAERVLDRRLAIAAAICLDALQAR